MREKVVSAYWSSTRFMAWRPKDSMWHFIWAQIWSENNPPWLKCRRSKLKAWWGSEYAALWKTFFADSVSTLYFTCQTRTSTSQRPCIFRSLSLSTVPKCSASAKRSCTPWPMRGVYNWVRSESLSFGTKHLGQGHRPLKPRIRAMTYLQGRIES